MRLDLLTLGALAVLAALCSIVTDPLVLEGVVRAVAWTPIAIAAAAAGDAFMSSRSNDRAAELSEAELAFLRQQYGDREPIRNMGLAQLQQPRPERPDLGGAFADPSNPFYSAPQPLGFGSDYTSQPPPMPEIAEKSNPGADFRNARSAAVQNVSDAAGRTSPWKALSDPEFRGTMTQGLNNLQRTAGKTSPWEAMGFGGRRNV